MKVSELTGAKLDYWVAESLGAIRGPYKFPTAKRAVKDSIAFPDEFPFAAMHPSELFKPSTNWSYGGPIIESRRIQLNYREHAYEGQEWAAQFFPSPAFPIYGYGPTPLIAAMRAFVASVYGDTVEDAV